MYFSINNNNNMVWLEMWQKVTKNIPNQWKTMHNTTRHNKTRYQTNKTNESREKKRRSFRHRTELKFCVNVLNEMSWCVVDGVVAFNENRLNSCEMKKKIVILVLMRFLFSIDIGGGLLKCGSWLRWLARAILVRHQWFD